MLFRNYLFKVNFTCYTYLIIYILVTEKSHILPIYISVSLTKKNIANCQYIKTLNYAVM